VSACALEQRSSTRERIAQHTLPVLEGPTTSSGNESAEICDLINEAVLAKLAVALVLASSPRGRKLCGRCNNARKWLVEAAARSRCHCHVATATTPTTPVRMSVR